MREMGRKEAGVEGGLPALSMGMMRDVFHLEGKSLFNRFKLYIQYGKGARVDTLNTLLGVSSQGKNFKSIVASNRINLKI